ncbi:type II toxin-antitoxin system RelE/ParE family toxin [Pararhodospirillum oryzae]|uniref:Addiction module toxin RelE n=1 Tax=Pararhodospirillum oryzae TaxID=478448 RepID=A0A512H5G3_9PROT|nr:type II toxin-antitoxin system RelE/ParE family toxin [Pararhodospirillum oryzae]GEO80709.1 hypothetical protein ROR02_08400 [Pararhodospirillum oryzae]
MPKTVYHYSLAITEEAWAELDTLWEADEVAAADLTILLEEIHDDLDLLEAMAIHRRQEGRYEVSRFLHLYAEGKDVWRLKIFSLERDREPFPYRIIYALDGRDHVYHVLGFMRRDQNYEQDQDFTQRIRERYRRLGLEES